MFSLNSFILFLYNAFIIFLTTTVKYIPHKDVNPFYEYLARNFGKYITKEDLQINQFDGNDLFPKRFLIANFIINGLVLMPAFVQQRRLRFLLTIWNLLLFHTILAMQVIIIWSLKENIDLDYIIIIMCVIGLLNAFHLRLIIKLKLGFLSHSTQRAAVKKVVAKHIDERGDGVLP